MTFEYAAYFKLLLLCGYNDELQKYIDTALIEQNPISDIVLELSTSSSDDKKMLSALNEYLLQVKDTGIDYDKTVFELVMSFLKIKYIEEPLYYYLQRIGSTINVECFSEKLERRVEV